MADQKRKNFLRHKCTMLCSYYHIASSKIEDPLVQPRPLYSTKAHDAFIRHGSPKPHCLCKCTRDRGLDQDDASRRTLILRSSGMAMLGVLTLADQSLTTIVNSVLGAYGLPKFKNSNAFKEFSDVDQGISFLYPGAWVQRANHQRAGVYISDFDTADKVVLEIFAIDDKKAPSLQLVEHFVNPAQEIGGDARLSMPSERNIKSKIEDRDGQDYTIVEFPTETVTRSGYQIKRKNIGVAYLKGLRLITLVASARSDQYNPQKKELFQQIVDSLRIIS